MASKKNLGIYDRIDKTRYAELDKHFPNAHQWFKERLKEMAK